VRADARLFLFAGPTLAASPRARELAKHFRVRPPVKRFDVEKLVATRGTPGVLVVVDGVFHDTLAVGHAELRDALRRGWRVWGLSSMGAIRAREMATLGMRGYGEVYARFAADGDFQDDEVALLHEGTPPYRGLTEPLVHLRAAVAHLVEKGIVAARAAAEVLRDLKSRWYGERSLRGMIEALGVGARGGVGAVRAELGDFRRFALKTRDLEAFVDERAWTQEGPGAATRKGGQPTRARARARKR
jgi:hypothetical protein